MALTLDTSHKSTSGLYHLCLRFSMNSKRYYYKLGEKYTAEEFDVICKADGRGRGGNINSSLVLLWIPTGKTIVWSFILLISVGLFLSIIGFSFRLDAGYILLYKIAFFFCITIYIIIVCLLFYMLHRRKIYAKDIEIKFLSCYERFKLAAKTIKRKTVKKKKKILNDEVK